MKSAILTFLLLSALVAGQGLLAVQEIPRGETMNLRLDLFNDTTQEKEPILGATVLAKIDFAEIELFDDGLHNDKLANDGVYGNSLVVDANVGSYVINYIITTKEGVNHPTIQQSIKVVEKEFNTTLLVSLLTVAIIIGMIAFYIRGIRRDVTSIKDSLKDLEIKKESIVKAMEDAQNDFFLRKIDEKTLTETVYNYKQELIQIDLQIKKLQDQENN